MGILQPMIHGTEITIRQYGSKRNQLKRYGLILENLDTFKKNNSIVSTYTENDFSISDNHAFNNFTEIIKKTNRDHALKTLLFNSLIGHKDYQYRIPDLLGKVAFNQNAPLGFKGLIYYNTDKTSLLSAANFDDSYFMKYQ